MEHIDWDNEEQVKQELDELTKKYVHLKKCAGSGGRLCPNCGSTKVKLLDEKELYVHTIKIRRCQNCNTEYTQYDVLVDDTRNWVAGWPYGVTTFSIEDYPHYIYFKPGTEILEGIGPDIYPWEE